MWPVGERPGLWGRGVGPAREMDMDPTVAASTLQGTEWFCGRSRFFKSLLERSNMMLRRCLKNYASRSLQQFLAYLNFIQLPEY